MKIRQSASISILLLSAGLCLSLSLKATTRTTKSTGLTKAAIQQLPNNTCANLRTSPAIFGLTITDLNQAGAATDYLQQLIAANDRVPLVVRVVFEPIKESKKDKFEATLLEYVNKVKVLRDGNGPCILGTIADSEEMHFYLPDSPDPKWPVGYRNYEKWTERLVTAMSGLVDIWEVGNEVNGEWYGWKDGKYKTNGEGKKPSPAYQRKRELKRNRIKEELSLAYRAIRRVRPATLTAITLVYNADQDSHHCYEFPEYEMYAWAREYLDSDLRSGVDFVLLSYYENTQDCSEVSRSPQQLVSVFSKLRDDFFVGDQTTFGFSETGYKQTCYRTDKPDEEIADDARINNPVCQAGQSDYVDRYYRILDHDLTAGLQRYNSQPNVKQIKFVGGYFYWYFLQDMVLSTNAESNTVRDILSKARKDFRTQGY